jgi:hypothetical protein
MALIAASQSRLRRPVPTELLQQFMQQAGKDPVVQLAVVAGCAESSRAALALLEGVQADGQPVGLECVVRMILTIRRDASLGVVVPDLLDKFAFERLGPPFADWVALLRRTWKPA